MCLSQGVQRNMEMLEKEKKLDFKGVWKSKNGRLAEVKEFHSGYWHGFVMIKGKEFPISWDLNGNCVGFPEWNLQERRRGDEPFGEELI